MTEPNDQDIDDRAKTALRVAAACAPALAGHPPEVQGAALAELVSAFLSGHFAGSPAATGKLRRVLLEAHIQAVRQLMAIEAARQAAQAKEEQPPCD